MKKKYYKSLIVVIPILLLITNKFQISDIVFSGTFFSPDATLPEYAVAAVVTKLPEESSVSSLQTAIDNAASGDTIEILGDIIFDGSVTIPSGKEITIRSDVGNSWTLMVGDSGARHFIIKGNLTLRDISLDGNKVGGGMYIYGGNFTMDEGVTIQNCHSYYGGGLELRSGSTFHMTGGTIRSNSSHFGGGVYGIDSTFVMTGGTIRENYTVGPGGGVYVQRTSFSMQDAVIENNTSVTCGGGVSMGEGSLSTATTMLMGQGAHIRNNKSDVGGGGINLSTYGSLTMGRGAVISGNISDSSGGGVKVYRNSELIMESGSEISNNTSVTYGGGAWIQSGRIEMNRGATINGNSSGAGGGIHLWYIADGYYPDQPNLLSGSIVNNKADNGGGVGIYKTTTENIGFQVIDSNISGNTASGNGGGIYIPSKATVDLKGSGRIAVNAAGGAGGGIYTEDTTYGNLSVGGDMVFYGNAASKDYVALEDTVTLYPQIQFKSSSITNHPLNNYDINYR